MAKQDNINQEDKPVGYGSSIQSSGNGNRSRPRQQREKNQSINNDGCGVKENRDKKEG